MVLLWFNVASINKVFVNEMLDDEVVERAIAEASSFWPNRLGFEKRSGRDPTLMATTRFKKYKI